MKLLKIAFILCASFTLMNCSKGGSSESETETSTGGTTGSPTPTTPPARTGELVVDKGTPTATEVNAQKIGLPSGVRPAGPPVNVDESKNYEAGKIVIAIPYGTEEGNLRGTSLAEIDTSLIVVIYHVKNVDGTYTLGVLPNAALDFSQEHVSFLSKGPGNYQAAYLPQPVAEEKSVVVETPVLTPAAQAKLPAIVWSELSGEITAARQFKIVGAVSTTDVTLDNCVVLMDSDKKYPYDQVASVTAMTSEHILVNTAAHDLYGRFQCQDNYGRLVDSAWTAKVSVPAEIPVTVNLVRAGSGVATDGYVNASESAANDPWLSETFSGEAEVSYSAWLTTPASTTCSSAMTYGLSSAPALSALTSDGAYWVCVKVTGVHSKVSYHITPQVTRDTTAPTVDAGTDIATAMPYVLTPTVNGASTFAWSGAGVTFSNANVANPTASASGAAAVYTITLTVTDPAGNSANDSLQFTWDQDAPDAGIIGIANLFWNGASAEVTYNWTPAQDAVSAPEAMQYKAFVSASNSENITTLEANGTQIATHTGGTSLISKTQASGLTTPGAVRYIYVIAADALGNKVLYAPRSFIIPASSDRALLQVGIGEGIGCGLDQEGYAFCWGSNTAGYLGTGSTTADVTVPAAVAGSFRYKKLAVGDNHACGIEMAGGVKCWGKNVSGAIGDGTTNVAMMPVDVNTASIGSVKFKDITAGADYSCGIGVNGAAYCWGENGLGTLGNASTSDSQIPVAVLINGGGSRQFVAIAAGTSNTCAVDDQRDLYCWGDNASLQIAASGTYHDARLMSAGGAKFLAPMAGSGFVCGLTIGGQVLCQGDNTNGKLGRNEALGMSFAAMEPVEKFDNNALDGIIQVAGRRNAACALSANNTLYCWGQNNSQMMLDATASYNYGYLVNTGALFATNIAVGSANVCGLNIEGDAFCWGENALKQSGSAGGSSVGQSQLNLTNVKPLSRLTSIAAAFSHGCGISTLGHAFCWGNGNTGELGHGMNGTEYEPVKVLGSHQFKSIAVGGQHSCGIRHDGAAFCWGYNAFGQLGNGNQTDTNTPVAVSGGDHFAQLSLGQYHSCGVTVAGVVKCWGNNADNQLGDGSGVHSSSAVAVSGSYVSVGAGSKHSCALASDGQVKCWGDNAKEQLGNVSASSVPATIVGGNRFASLAIGDQHGCGVRGGGLPYCWGDNAYSQIGNGFVGASTETPQQISASPVRDIAAAQEHSCLIKDDFVLACWGRNNNGQLGRNTMSAQEALLSDVVGPTMPKARQLSSGGRTNCAVYLDGASYCWGVDGSGQLGDMKGDLFQLTPSRVNEFSLQ